MKNAFGEKLRVDIETRYKRLTTARNLLKSEPRSGRLTKQAEHPKMSNAFWLQ